MAANAGRGYSNGNYGPSPNNRTVVERTVTCDADGWVTEIEISLSTNGGTLKIGVCDLDTFIVFTCYPGDFVTIDTGTGTGIKIFKAASGDFTPFFMQAGQRIVFYSRTTGNVTSTMTNTSPRGYHYSQNSGDYMSSANFNTVYNSSIALEVEFRGVADLPTWQHRLNNVGYLSTKTIAGVPINKVGKINGV